jgi:heme/copper-type cytochrome/quinol oxidase subunit 1
VKKLTDTGSRLNSSGIFSQLMWLVVAAVITILFAVFVLKWDVSEEWRYVDVYFYDTYFIIGVSQVLPTLFLGVTLLIFLIKENSKKFSRSLPNAFILITGVLLIIFLSLGQRLFPDIEGWTIYPPLSALGGSESPRKSEAGADDIISYFLTGLQVLVTLSLLHVAWHRGRSKPNN